MIQPLTERQKQLVKDHIAALQAVLDCRDVEIEYFNGDNWHDDGITHVSDYTLFGVYPRRIKRKPQYRPFRKGDNAKLVGRVVIAKNEECRAMITRQLHDVSVNGVNWSFDELFKYFTFDDGSPCGVME